MDVPLEAMFGEATINDLIQFVGSKGKSEESLGLIDGIDFSKEYVLGAPTFFLSFTCPYVLKKVITQILILNQRHSFRLLLHHALPQAY